jgi:hypothetical protein
MQENRYEEQSGANRSPRNLLGNVTLITDRAGILRNLVCVANTESACSCVFSS